MKIWNRITASINKAVQKDLYDCRTIPGVSESAYKDTLKKNIKWTNCRARIAALRAYHGGRGEVFRRGELRHGYESDMKEAYARAMISIGEFPLEVHPVKTIKELLKCKNGWGRFLFNAHDLHVPPFPVQSTKNKALLWPSKGRTDCGFDEVRIALKYGVEVKIVEAWGYEHGDSSLSKFISRCVEERHKSKGDMNLVWKLMSNSLYGKLVQHVIGESVKKIAMICEEFGIDPWEWHTKDRQEKDIIIAAVNNAREQRGKKPIDPKVIILGSCFMPEWACMITSRIRAWLFEAMMQSKGLMECVTDSIWAENKADGNLWEEKRKGKMIVAARCQGMIIESNGKKRIQGGGTFGAKPPLKLLVKFQKNGSNADVSFRYKVKRFMKPRESFLRGRNVGTVSEAWRIATTEWDNKRILNRDGSTVPWPTLHAYEEFLETGNG
jgi:hypothetical protein